MLGFDVETLLKGESLFGQLDYTVRRAGGSTAVVTGNDYRGRPLHFPLARGRGTAFMDLGHTFRAALPPGTEVCFRAAGVGWIAP
jgi:hypothetical protein